MLELVDPYKNNEPGHLLYFDNFYASIELIEILQTLCFWSKGTIRKDRKVCLKSQWKKS